MYNKSIEKENHETINWIGKQRSSIYGGVASTM